MVNINKTSLNFNLVASDRQLPYARTVLYLIIYLVLVMPTLGRRLHGRRRCAGPPGPPQSTKAAKAGWDHEEEVITNYKWHFMNATHSSIFGCERASAVIVASHRGACSQRSEGQ